MAEREVKVTLNRFSLPCEQNCLCIESLQSVDKCVQLHIGAVAGR